MRGGVHHLGKQFAFGHYVRQCLRRCHHHVDGDGLRGCIQRAAEYARIRQGVVHLPPVSGDSGPGLAGVLDADLADRVGQREDNRVLGHRPDHLLGDEVRPGHADEQVPSSHGFGDAASDVLGVGPLGKDDLLGIHALGSTLVDDALGVRQDHVLNSGMHEEVGNRGPGCARPGNRAGDVRHAFADLPQRTVKARQDDRGRAVLVVVEDRDIQSLVERAGDLEALRGRDVLDLYRAERGSDSLADVDELLRVAGVYQDRLGRDAGELPENRRLALHNRHPRQGAYVAKAQNGRAVGDDGDLVWYAGELACLGWVGLDGLADFRHARRVDDPQVGVGCDGHAASHLAGPAAMHLHRHVQHFEDLDVSDCRDSLSGRGHLLVAFGEDAQLVDHRVLQDPAQVDLPDVGARPDGRRDNRAQFVPAVQKSNVQLKDHVPPKTILQRLQRCHICSLMPVSANQPTHRASQEEGHYTPVAPRCKTTRRLEIDNL